MEKKKILFVYSSMVLGGSTTALVSLLNGLDYSKYQVDLQLYRSDGEFMNMIPEAVNVLTPAIKYTGRFAKVFKLFKYTVKGYPIRKLFSKVFKCAVACSTADFAAKELSIPNKKKYDYAVGYLEGWSARYLTWGVKNAGKKYAWLHSTFDNITTDPKTELPWMKKVDKIVFVTDACREAFEKKVPKMAHKTMTVANITDSSLIRRRADDIDKDDNEYKSYISCDSFKIISVFRLHSYTKGLDRIVSCAKRMKKEGRKFLWYVIGDGVDSAAFASMIKEQDVGDMLVPVGRRTNPYPFIKAADIMCMPSRYEGRPIIVTECMILGVPCAVTEYLSSREQISDGKEGLIVPNTDDSIYTAVSRFMDDRKMLSGMKDYLLDHEYGNSDYIRQTEKELFTD